MLILACRNLEKSLLALFGSILGVFGMPLGYLWGTFGFLLDYFGFTLAVLEPPWGPLWSTLASFWMNLGAFWSTLHICTYILPPMGAQNLTRLSPYRDHLPHTPSSFGHTPLIATASTKTCLAGPGSFWTGQGQLLANFYQVLGSF